MTYPNWREITAAIEKVSATNPCEACSHQRWMLPSENGEAGTAEIMMMVKPTSLTSGFAFAPLICRQCGNTRLIHIETLMRSANNDQ